MYRSFGLMVALLLAGALAGCGDDAKPSDASKGGKDAGSSTAGGKDAAASGSTGGTKGKPGAGGSGGDTVTKDAGTEPAEATDAGGGTGIVINDAGVPTIDGGEVCGPKVCGMNECCQDPFIGRCGVEITDLQTYSNGQRACLLPPPPDSKSDSRCPSVNIMNVFTLSSCCTSKMQCGLDLSMFNYGCVENSEVKKNAMMMGGGGSGIMWPDAKACN